MNTLQSIKHEAGNITNGMQAEIQSLIRVLNNLHAAGQPFTLDVVTSPRPGARTLRDLLTGLENKNNRLREFLAETLKDVK